MSSVSLDDACDPEQAKAVAKQLVSEGVSFVAGHVCSGASMAASSIYTDANIIMISPSSTNPKVTDDGGPNIFRVIGRDDQQGIIAGDFIADKFPGKNIAIVHDGSAYGKGLAEFTKGQLGKRNITEFLLETYKAEQTDYTSLIEKLVSAKVDVVYAGGYQGDIGIILRQAKQSLPDIQLLSGDALVNADFLSIAGDAAKGTLFTFGPDIRLFPEAASAVAAIRDEDAYEPDGYTLYAYGAVQAWAQAVEKAGSLDSSDVIKTLKSGSFDTALGKIGFDEKGDVTGISAFVWYVFDEEGYSLAK